MACGALTGSHGDIVPVGGRRFDQLSKSDGAGSGRTEPVAETIVGAGLKLLTSCSVGFVS